MKTLTPDKPEALPFVDDWAAAQWMLNNGYRYTSLLIDDGGVDFFIGGRKVARWCECEGLLELLEKSREDSKEHS